MNSQRQRLISSSGKMASLNWMRSKLSLKSNVILYGGPGVGSESLAQAKNTLKLCFNGYYDVIVVSGVEFTRDNWEPSTAAVVVPGGRDLPIIGAIGSTGFTRIREFVASGGRYIGFCAGAYLASDRVEFEAHRPEYKVEGERPLNFFAGVARGAAYPGFNYNSEAGARLANLLLDSTAVRSYYNGGPVFEPYDSADENTTVVGTYTDDGSPLAGPLNAVVIARVNRGKALLSSAHFEFLDPSLAAKTSPLNQIGSARAQVEFQKRALGSLIDLLTRLDLRVNPSDSPAYDALLKGDKRDVYQVSVTSLRDSGSIDQLVAQSTERYSLRRAVDAISETEKSYWENRRKLFGRTTPCDLGGTLLYAPSVDSSQLLLESVCRDSYCPNGLVALADRQTAGKGRGSNGWISQEGCLQFSMLLKFARNQLPAYLVCLQYLLALIMVETARLVDPNAPVYIKWPNDIYATSPVSGAPVKVGGVLVQSYTNGSHQSIVAGCGINVSNRYPTTSLHDISPKLSAISKEEYLANFLENFNLALNVFIEKESFDPFLQRYYAVWLHTNQRVKLDSANSLPVIIRGIDKHGFLSVETVGNPAETFNLQPDYNSFDMLSGLLKVKESN